jgi:hypothetical protein
VYASKGGTTTYPIVHWSVANKGFFGSAATAAVSLGGRRPTGASSEQQRNRSKNTTGATPHPEHHHIRSIITNGATTVAKHQRPTHNGDIHALVRGFEKQGISM